MDDHNYGKFFWDQWKKGMTVARSFLDASWRISHSQVPVVMAVGSNATDAKNRLNNERYFTRTPVTKGWYQWQWIGSLRGRSFTYKSAAPKRLNALLLDNKLFDDDGNRMISSRNMALNVNREGALNICLGNANIRSTDLIDQRKAV